MERDVLVGLTVIVAFGVGGQWLAARLRVPSILVLLLAGFVAGPVRSKNAHADRRNHGVSSVLGMKITAARP